MTFFRGQDFVWCWTLAVEATMGPSGASHQLVTPLAEGCHCIWWHDVTGMWCVPLDSSYIDVWIVAYKYYAGTEAPRTDTPGRHGTDWCTCRDRLWSYLLWRLKAWRALVMVDRLCVNITPWWTRFCRSIFVSCWAQICQKWLSYSVLFCHFASASPFPCPFLPSDYDDCLGSDPHSVASIEPDSLSKL